MGGRLVGEGCVVGVPVDTASGVTFLGGPWKVT